LKMDGNRIRKWLITKGRASRFWPFHQFLHSFVGAALFSTLAATPLGQHLGRQGHMPLLQSLGDRGAAVAINMALPRSFRSLRPKVRVGCREGWRTPKPGGASDDHGKPQRHPCPGPGPGTAPNGWTPNNSAHGWTPPAACAGGPS